MTDPRIQDLLPSVSRRQLMAGAAALSTTAVLPITARADGTRLNVRAELEPGDDDPLDASGCPEELLSGCICRKLIQYAPGDDWEWQLDPAESIQQTSPTTIAFTLKPEQMWSDGFGEITAEIAKEAGDVDFTAISPASVARLGDTAPAGMRPTVHPSLFYHWIGPNVQNPKFADTRVRQAIMHAIDIPSILQASFFDVAKAATGIIAPGLIGHRDATLIPSPADPARARALLDEAGVDRLEANLDVLNTVIHTTAAQVMQATMAQAGIDLTISVRESGAFWSLGVAADGDRWKDPEMTIKRFSMLPDPFHGTAWFVTDQIGDWNWEQFSNEEFDRLHEEAAAATDPAVRDGMYRRMQDLMEESGGYRFITHGITANLFAENIRPAVRPDGLPQVQFFRRA